LQNVVKKSNCNEEEFKNQQREIPTAQDMITTPMRLTTRLYMEAAPKQVSDKKVRSARHPFCELEAAQVILLFGSRIFHYCNFGVAVAGRVHLPQSSFFGLAVSTRVKMALGA
jgi:hypothetical protein